MRPRIVRSVGKRVVRPRMTSAPAANTNADGAHSPLARIGIYVTRIRQFQKIDWIVYLSWIGLMSGLCLTTAGFVWLGHRAAAPLPTEAWLVPLGAVIFTLAIAIDTIGHRTIYKEALRGGEALVHQVIILAGIASCALLCAAYTGGALYAVPALVLTILSFVYSLVDEAMHWRRYLAGKSDPVEMWSHVFILIGHGVMMTGWWLWYWRGYLGVAETLAALTRIFHPVPG
jgi:hypothetical protein